MKSGRSNFLKNMVYIGYWYSEHEPELPKPLISKKEGQGVRLAVLLQKLESRATRYSLVGVSHCRICNCRNGHEEFVLCLGGKIFSWPQGLRHYLVAHNVEMLPEFFDMLAIAANEGVL